MKINITSRKFKAKDSLKEHINEEVNSLEKFSDDHLGMMPLEWAIRTAKYKEISPRIIERMLGYWNDYIPEGPYDKSIDKEIIPLLANHNRKISKRQQRLAQKPQWASSRIAENNLQMWFTLADGSQLNITTKAYA